MVTPPDRIDLSPGTIEGVLATVSLPLRRALVLRFGLDVGSEAHADAVAFALENSDRVLTLSNPAGYLFRVGQSSAKRLRRWGRTLEAQRSPAPDRASDVPELDRVLEALKPNHRAAVVLVHGYGYSYQPSCSVSPTRRFATTSIAHWARFVGTFP